MRKIILNSAILLLFSAQVLNSQSAKKVFIQSPTNPNSFSPGIYPKDVSWNGYDGKVIGYSFITPNNKETVSVLSLADNNTTQFSKIFVNNTNPNGNFEVIRVIPDFDFTSSKLFVLAALQTGTTDRYLPVVLELDKTTGNIVHQYYFNNIPIIENFFIPTDIQIDHPGIIRLLCAGLGNPNPSGIRSSFYYIEFDPSTNSYSTTKINNSINSSATYDYRFVSFIKGYHYYSPNIYGNLSFYALEVNDLTTNINRGIVFNEDYSNLPICKAFTLSGRTTKAIQVNNSFNDLQTIAIQNNANEFYTEGNTFLNTISWQKEFTNNSPAFFNLWGLSHGSKGRIDGTSTDFFTAIYEQTGNPLSGYSFFRYDFYDGSLKQTYNYDLNVEFFNYLNTNRSFSRSFINDLTNKYYFVGNAYPNTSLTYQYLYLIENNINDDQTSCVNTPRFDETQLTVTKDDVKFDFTLVSTNTPTSTISISEISAPNPIIQPICSDFGTREGRMNISENKSSDHSLSTIYDQFITNLNEQSIKTFDKQSAITFSKEQTFIRVSSTKFVAGYAVYNEIGQLVNRNNVNLKKDFQINLDNLRNNGLVFFIEILFNDGTKEIKKIII